MSLNLLAYPAALSSLHGDLIYTVEYAAHVTDPIGYPNYKFIGDVYVNSVLVARVKRVPDPITGVGIFNIGNIVRNYVTTVFAPVLNQLISQTMSSGDFYLAVQMKFGEEYAYTAYTNLLEDDTRVFFNNYNGRLVGTLTSLTDKVNKSLSNRPYINTVKKDAILNLLPFMATHNDADVNISFNTYDFANSLVFSGSTAITPPVLNQLYSLNLTKDGINQVFAGIINDGIKFFDVALSSVYNTDGTFYRFNIECECNYDSYTLHFLNQYGGFESALFNKVSRKTVSIEKKSFGKLPYKVDGFGAVSYKSDANVYNETNSTYSSIYKEKMILNSDLLTDGQYRWLQELVVSPMVYLEDNGYFIPVNITDTNYEAKKFVNDEMSNLTISIEFGNQLNAQFR